MSCLPVVLEGTTRVGEETMPERLDHLLERPGRTVRPKPDTTSDTTPEKMSDNLVSPGAEDADQRNELVADG